MALLLACVTVDAADAALPGTPPTLSITPPAPGDLLLPGDLLHIEVYDNPDLTVDVRVPSEGTVPFPLVGRLDILPGTTGDGLAQSLRRQLEARGLDK
jgi:protein involved in polysaccharide export with SLBB domain